MPSECRDYVLAKNPCFYSISILSEMLGASPYLSGEQGTLLVMFGVGVVDLIHLENSTSDKKMATSHLIVHIALV